MTSALLVAGLLLAPPDYMGWQLVELQPANAEERETALALADDVASHGRRDGAIQALVSPQSRATLEVAGIEFEVMVADVRAAIDSERARIDAAPEPITFDMWFEEFRDLAAIEAQLDTYAADFPTLATLTDVGTSFELRPIRSMRISGSASAKPTLVYVGTQHAREWISPMVTMCVADHFIRGYGVDTEVTALLDSVELRVVPVANPDGYVQTWGPDCNWRKNMRDGSGVDLNRNWSEGWGLSPGSSPDPNEDTYRGTSPFSESETADLSAWITGLADVRTLVDFHSFGALIVSSWAYTNTPPDDLETLVAWGDAMERQMDAPGPHDFTSLHGFEANNTLGNASGTLPDWTHANLGIPAFTVELPPAFGDGSGWDFELPPTAISPICEQAIEGVLEQARWAAADGVLELSISDPPDGATYSEGEVVIPISMDVTTPGPVEVGLRIDGTDLPWADEDRPFGASDVLFPVGTFTVIATAETWDGLTAESAPITITITEPGSETSSETATESGTSIGSSTDDNGSDSGELGTGTDGVGLDSTSGCACGVADAGSRSTAALWAMGVVVLRRRRRRS